MTNRNKPPKLALKNINIAFLGSFIQSKKADNKTIIKSNILSLKIVDIILAVCPKIFICSKLDVITSNSLVG